MKRGHTSAIIDFEIEISEMATPIVYPEFHWNQLKAI